MLNKVHHIAIICSDYKLSKRFYTQVLGMKPLREEYRKERDSWKLDLELNGQYIIELFSFPDPPKRPSWPEAAGLRHLAFEVDDIDQIVDHLKVYGIEAEPVRLDHVTQKRFTFISDPDGLPIEFYEK